MQNSARFRNDDRMLLLIEYVRVRLAALRLHTDAKPVQLPNYDIVASPEKRRFDSVEQKGRSHRSPHCFSCRSFTETQVVFVRP